MDVIETPVTELIPFANNARTHSDEQVAEIAASIKEFGFTNPVLTDGKNGVIAGHGRLLAARKLNMDTVPCIELSHLSETQKRAYILADNRLAEKAGWDFDLVSLELESLLNDDFDIELTGFDDSFILDEGDYDASNNEKLSDKFLVPPFTVINAREGWWQDRKRAWIGLGIQSELGRAAQSNALASTFDGSTQSLQVNTVLDTDTGTSIFDPVLCELLYLWFSKAGDTVLDPFAGGSVRGIVASALDRQYIGHELRTEQVLANRVQGDEVCSDNKYAPVWIQGDSKHIDKSCADVKADMIISCPPYADLEVYSDDEADISSYEYQDFLAAYKEIINKTCQLLKEDSFACFVVGEVRDKKGNYYNFVGDTVDAFKAAGLKFYNEAIIVTCLGTVQMQTSRNFPIARKLGKTHQNVLVFVKGDGKTAATKCGTVAIPESVFDEIEAA